MVDEDLRANPRLVSDLVFSPHPVLVEGDRDLAAFQQEPRIHQQVVQSASLRGVQSEVSPRVIVPAQTGRWRRRPRRSLHGSRPRRSGSRGLLRVDQEVGEGLMVHAKRAIRCRAVQELPGRARHPRMAVRVIDSSPSRPATKLSCSVVRPSS
jgi:hypothetical protein